MLTQSQRTKINAMQRNIRELEVTLASLIEIIFHHIYLNEAPDKTELKDRYCSCPDTSVCYNKTPLHCYLKTQEEYLRKDFFNGFKPHFTVDKIK